MDPVARRERPPTTTFNILFVCTGNTCRSPMAEAFARAEVARRGWRNVEVRSAGVAARAGSAATPEACAVMSRRGLELAVHRSALLEPELVEWADLVLAMSHSHLHVIAGMDGANKAALLDEFAAADPGSGEGIPDPFGGDEEEYEATARALEKLVSDALDRLVPILEP